MFLGKSMAPKTDEFSENVQTVLDLPHDLFMEGNICAFWHHFTIEYIININCNKFLDWK